MAVTAVSKRLCDLGEGPYWDNFSRKLYYVDAFVGDVCRLDPETGDTEAVHFEGTVTLAIPFQSNPGHLLVTHGKDVRMLDFGARDSKIVSCVDPGNPNSRFNDGKCDPLGRFWAGTLVENHTGCGKLYCMDSSYKFCSFADGVDLANGLTWSVDYKILYFVDSGKKIIYAFDFNLEHGTAGNQRIVIDFNEDENYSRLGVPDGMTTDTDGKLWIACFGGGCVIQVEPADGTILQKVDIPAKETTSCCFGGPNFDILYVTSSSRFLSEVERKKEPLSGAVFAATGLGVRGTAAFSFSG